MLVQNVELFLACFACLAGPGPQGSGSAEMNTSIPPSPNKRTNRLQRTPRSRCGGMPDISGAGSVSWVVRPMKMKTRDPISSHARFRIASESPASVLSVLSVVKERLSHHGGHRGHGGSVGSAVCCPGRSNQPAAGNAGFALRFQLGHRRSGVPEPGRSAQDQIW